MTSTTVYRFDMATKQQIVALMSHVYLRWLYRI
jgi:hypothetical protein